MKTSNKNHNPVFARRILQKLVIGLSFVALTLAIILIARYFLLYRSDRLPAALSITSSTAEMTDTESSNSTSVSESETETSVSEISVSENLQSDQIVENYFGPLPAVTQLTPFTHTPVHGIYIGAAMNLEANIALAESSNIDTFIIDLKEGSGIYFDTTNDLALSLGYVYPEYNLEDLCNQCHEHGIRVIGRLVCFKDPTLASSHPERAICDAGGTPLAFENEGGSAFVSPYNTENWSYLIDLAKEAVSMGVDEIQLDYVRFPTGSDVDGRTPFYGADGEVPTRAQTINRFLQTFRREVQDPLGIPVSADVFGITVSSSIDGNNLGQDWATVGLTGIDSVCPMIYPSHYALGTILNGNTYPYPDKNPYGLMFDALKTGENYDTLPGYTTVRPYIQAFTASYIGEGNYIDYGYTEINDQIRAIEDCGLDEWILWNPSGQYPSGSYSGNEG